MHPNIDRRRLIGGGLLLGLSAALPAAAKDKESPRWSGVRALIADDMAKKAFPGAVAAIGRGRGEPDYLSVGTLAFDGKKPVGPNTLWRIYSMTKPVTGMAAMILIGEGRMKLDQPLSDFIPAYARMRVMTDPEKSLDSVPAKTPITIRHLLTHTAGLGYTIVTKGPLLDAYYKQGIVPMSFSHIQPPDMPPMIPAPSLKDFADRLATLPLIAEPGTKWSYSVALDLMGRVIEIVSGRPFDAFLHERIFAPLGMTSTFFQVPADRAEDLATNYFHVNGTAIPIDPGARSVFLDKPAFPFGGSGLVSSARDYDRFLAMLVNGGTLGKARIMAPRTVRLGMSNLLPEGVPTDGPPLNGHGFGAGGRVTLTGVTKGVYGWAGAAGTVAWADPRRRLRGGGYVNYMPTEIVPWEEAFPIAVYGDLA